MIPDVLPVISKAETTLDVINVAEVNVAEVNVPDEIEGPEESTTLPLPVEVVVPVPPLITFKAVPENPIANVPELVIGDPVILKKAGTVAATLVTVPTVGVVQVIAVTEPP